jgi:phosphoglycolate phosphatase
MPSSNNLRFPVQNIIFDLDGTLVDSLAGIEASMAHALHDCLPSGLPGDLRRHIGPPIPEMFVRLFPDFEADTIKRLVAAFREHYDRKGYRESRLYPSVAQTLAALRNLEVVMFVLTNKPILATRAILDHAGISSYFTAIISASPDFAGKPDAAESLRRQYDLDPARTVVVGDGVDDRKAAERCGFDFILAGYGYGSAAAGDAHCALGVLKSFDEIPILLGKIKTNDSPRLF